jgi:fatty-acyl-CoA synthase
MTEFYGCRTLGEVVARQARARPEAVAMIFEDQVTRYAELDAHANQVANTLAAMGLGPQDRVAYLGKNSDLFSSRPCRATRAARCCAGNCANPIGKATSAA